MKNLIIDLLSKKGVVAGLCLVVGILLVIFKGYTAQIICTVTGAILIALAVWRLVKQAIRQNVQEGLIFNLVLLAMGLTLALFSWFVPKMIAMIIGTILVIKGFFEIREAMIEKRLGDNRWQVDLVFACIGFVFGVVLTLIPWAALDVVAVLIGIVLIVEATLSIIALIVDATMGKNQNQSSKKPLSDYDFIVSAEKVDEENHDDKK